MTTKPLVSDFERHALKGACLIAADVVVAAKEKRSLTIGFSTAAFIALAIPLLLKMQGAEELVYGAPPFLMGLALYDARKKQKKMQANFEDSMNLVPDGARGIVSGEIDTMRKTLMSMPTEVSKKDFDLKKRGPQLLAPAILLVPPMTPLALPGLLYLMAKEDWDKTKDLINQADIVIESNKQYLTPPQP